MEKVVDRILNYKFSDVPSAITNCAQRQQQHAAEQGEEDAMIITTLLRETVTISTPEKQSNGEWTVKYSYSDGTFEGDREYFKNNTIPIINAMIQTPTGREMVEFLCSTKSKIRIKISDDIGVEQIDDNTYGMLLGIRYALKETLNIDDRDGKKTKEYQEIIIYKGSYKFAQEFVKKGIYSLEDQNVELWIDEGNSKRRNDIEGSILKPQYPEKIPQSYFDLFNRIGVHESVHTMPENQAARGRKQENQAMAKEAQTREEQVGVPQHIINFYE